MNVSNFDLNFQLERGGVRSLDMLHCLSTTEGLKKAAGLSGIFLLGPCCGRLRSKLRGGGGGVRRMMKSQKLLTMGGVIFHKVFGLLRCDHIDVTHLNT